jgi:hypothetical protein
MKKAPLRLLILAAVLSAAAAARAAEAPPPSAVALSTVAVSTVPAAPFQWRAVDNKAFAVGETLVFAIKYGFITGGHAGLDVRSTETVHGRPAYHIVSEARTNNTMDVIFKVRDLNETWMDVESLCSHKYHQIMNEGHYFREVESRYDHPNASFNYWRKTKKGESREQGAIPPFVHDVLSSLYFLRTQPLTPGQDIVLAVNSGAQSWSLRVRVKGVETVDVPAGKFTCYRIEPLLTGEGLFMQTGNLEVWMTTDERRLPVLMRSKVKVGAFTAELESVKP